MSRSVSCALCGREVDDSETVEMPNGMVCLDPCYLWLERMIEESEDAEETIEFDDDDDEDEYG